jgi:ABC-type glutathione transport system ATPase component
MKKKKNTALPAEAVELTPEEIAAIEREREIIDQSAPYHNGERLLSARGVKVNFNLRGAELTAIRGASLDVYEGETLAIVGESGSGKSVTSKAILGILPQNASIDSGKIIFDGTELTSLSEKELCLTVRLNEGNFSSTAWSAFALL